MYTCSLSQVATAVKREIMDHYNTEFLQDIPIVPKPTTDAEGTYFVQHQKINMYITT